MPFSYFLVTWHYLLVYTEPFTYRPWEYTSIDVDEEDEDAEADAEEEEMEEEEVRHQVFVFIILTFSAHYCLKLTQIDTSLPYAVL